MLSFGRFGQLLTEIARRGGADVQVLEAEWGTVFKPEQVEDALKRHSPKLVAVCQGDTSTTMAQPLDRDREALPAHGAPASRPRTSRTATLGGMPLPADAWQIDRVTGGLQKRLGGPSGAGPITISERMAEAVYRRRHIEGGPAPEGLRAGRGRDRRLELLLDLATPSDYWSDLALNHHTEATSMLYAARECGRIFVREGHLLAAFSAATRSPGQALVAGVEAIGLMVFGDQAHKMPNVTGAWIPLGAWRGTAWARRC